MTQTAKEESFLSLASKAFAHVSKELAMEHETPTNEGEGFFTTLTRVFYSACEKVKEDLAIAQAVLEEKKSPHQ